MSSPLWLALCTIRTSRRELCCRTGQTQPPVLDLVSLAQVRPQLLFHVLSHLGECLAAVFVVEVANPTADGCVDFSPHPLNRHGRSHSLGEFGCATLDRLQELFRRLDVRI